MNCTKGRIGNELPAAILAVTLSVAAFGCGSGDGAASGVVVRDSAGIEIVESYEPVWPTGERWTVSEIPLASIGSDDASDDYSLYRVMAALRLPNGNIVIANSGTSQLKFYDSSGVFLRSVGRAGDGPGEFRRMWGAWHVGDSIFVSDYGPGRVTVYSNEGEFGRAVTLEKAPDTFMVTAVGGFSDGSMLSFEFVIDRNAPPGDGIEYIDSNYLYRRYSREGSVLDSLGVFFSRETVREATTITNPTTGETGMGMVSATAPFSREGTTVARGDYLYNGSGGAYEIQVFTRDGTLRRLVRRPIPRPAVTEQDMDLFREDWLEDANDWMKKRVLDLRFPDTKPAYGTFKVDALGNIWVADYSLARKYNTGAWTVFDPEGRMLGVVQIPPAGSVTTIGDDYVMGVWRTELDVEQVRAYRVMKGDG